MMPRYLSVFCVCAAIAASAAPVHAAGLQHDLFARPPLEALKPEQPQSVKTVTPAIPPPEWKPELRAIIAGAGTAIVNVEGRIVQMGQEMDGYRLVEVQERRATFVRDKVRYTLLLNAVKGADAPAGSGSAKAAEPTTGSDAVKGGENRSLKGGDTPAGLGSLKTSDVLGDPRPAQPDAPRTPAATAARQGG